MFDYIAYLIAQQHTAARAEAALPGSPVQPEPVPSRLARLSDASRHYLSDGLRWFADRLEPNRPSSTTRLDCPSQG